MLTAWKLSKGLNLRQIRVKEIKYSNLSTHTKAERENT